VFFSSQLLGLLISIFSSTTQDFFSIQKILLLLAVPLLFVSLYFQKFVEKKWCPICLLIISLVFIELCSLYYIGCNYTLKNIILFGFLFIIIFYTWKSLKSLLTKQKELIEYQLKANRFQRNYSLFKNTLLSKKTVDFPNIPIILGNQDSKIMITVITNPFCGHCAGVHKIVDRIIERNTLNLQVRLIIKTSFDYLKNEEKEFFRSLLNSYFEYGEKEFSKRLNEWFANKNLTNWLKKYKYKNIEQIKINSIYKGLENWCTENNFNYTPAIFINGYEYPNVYEREQLEFFINEIIEDTDFT
jgi:hypothetical protein